MNKKKLLKVIEEAKNVIEWHDEDGDKAGYYSFTMEAISSKNPIYEILSDYLYNKDDISTKYGYEMLGQAISDIDEMIDGVDDNFNVDDLDDEISSRADSQTPIYNSEILDFISSNPYAVDEAINELGKGESIINDGMSAYYLKYSEFLRDILGLLVEYSE